MHTRSQRVVQRAVRWIDGYGAPHFHNRWERLTFSSPPLTPHTPPQPVSSPIPSPFLSDFTSLFSPTILPRSNHRTFSLTHRRARVLHRVRSPRARASPTAAAGRQQQQQQHALRSEMTHRTQLHTSPLRFRGTPISTDNISDDHLSLRTEILNSLKRKKEHLEP